MMGQVIDGREINRQLVEKGIVPDKCRRVVIDITFNKPVIIYCELYGSEELLELDLPGLLEDAVIINVSQEAMADRENNMRLKELNKELACQMGCLEPNEEGKPSCDPPCICCKAIAESEEAEVG